MSVQKRFVVFIALVVFLLALTGCVGVFLGNDLQAIDSPLVTASMQYLEGPEVGAPYNVSVTVPDEWVGEFNVRNIGNVLYFEYTGEGSRGVSEVFSIEALSMAQYWEQSGSYPGSYANLVNLGDTYFVYYLPIDAYYSGLSEEKFTSLTEMVPGIVASFTAESAE